VTVILALVTGPGHTGTAGWLNTAVGIADDLLFLTISGFAATVWAAREAYGPARRWFGLAVSLICLARGALGFARLEGWLGFAAPLSFLALVAALSVRMLRQPRPAAAGSPG